MSGSVAMSRKVMALARAAKNSHLSLNTNQLANIKNSDQALVVALVITNETVFIEKFQSHKKIFISIHGEAMLFDFKAKTVIRSYPINAMIFDAKVGEVASNDLESLAARLIYADDGKSLLHQFAKKLEVLSIPSPGTKTAQIKQVQIAPEAMAHYPNALQSAGLAQSIMADEFSTVLLSRQIFPALPQLCGSGLRICMTMN